MLRPVRIVDATIQAQRLFLPEWRQSADTIEQNAWGDISHAFSQPIEASDDDAAYAPTQVLAETIAHAGFDGLAYRSAYGKGHNIVLFDPRIAEVANCTLVRVADLQFTLEDDQSQAYEVEASGASSQQNTPSPDL